MASENNAKDFTSHNSSKCPASFWTQARTFFVLADLRSGWVLARLHFFDETDERSEVRRQNLLDEISTADVEDFAESNRFSSLFRCPFLEKHRCDWRVWSLWVQFKYLGHSPKSHSASCRNCWGEKWAGPSCAGIRLTSGWESSPLPPKTKFLVSTQW